MFLCPDPKKCKLKGKFHIKNNTCIASNSKHNKKEKKKTIIPKTGKRSPYYGELLIAGVHPQEIKRFREEIEKTIDVLDITKEYYSDLIKKLNKDKGTSILFNLYLEETLAEIQKEDIKKAQKKSKQKCLENIPFIIRNMDQNMLKSFEQFAFKDDQRMEEYWNTLNSDEKKVFAEGLALKKPERFINEMSMIFNNSFVGLIEKVLPGEGQKALTKKD